MVGAISPISAAYSTSAIYGVNRSATQNLVYRRGSDPNTPVQPVRPTPVVTPDSSNPVISGVSLWDESYAAEQAVRLRMQYTEPDIQNASQKIPGDPITQSPEALKLPASLSYDPVEMAVRMRIQYIDPSAETAAAESKMGIDDVQKAGEEGRCETCEKRKYQDGSDDPSVSFQTPTQIDPNTAAATVRGHEMEHVFHEQARAEREDRKVVSQSVMLHTGICPECGKVYVSGGTTRTVTKADSEPEAILSDDSKNNEK